MWHIWVNSLSGIVYVSRVSGSWTPLMLTWKGDGPEWRVLAPGICEGD